MNKNDVTLCNIYYLRLDDFSLFWRNIKILMCDPFKDIFLVFFNGDDIPVRISLCSVINSISSTSICVHLLYWQAWLGMKNCLDSYNTYTTPKQSYISIYYQQSLHFLFLVYMYFERFSLFIRLIREVITTTYLKM